MTPQGLVNTGGFSLNAYLVEGNMDSVLLIKESFTDDFTPESVNIAELEWINQREFSFQK